jgi:hypothetical protein
MADLFKLLSSRSSEAGVPAFESTHTKTPVHQASSQDAVTLTPIPPPQVTPVQPGKQRAKAGKTSGLTLSNLSDQMSVHPMMAVDQVTSTNRLLTNNTHHPSKKVQGRPCNYHRNHQESTNQRRMVLVSNLSYQEQDVRHNTQSLRHHDHSPPPKTGKIRR